MKQASTRVFLPPVTASMCGPGTGAGYGSDRPRTSIAGPKPGAAGPGTWSKFWQEFGLENQPQERCHIPGDGQIAVDRHWARFAGSLPAGARVIDLGCGAGIVGRALLSQRNDLDIVGVDWADVPIVDQANLRIHPGVCMEALPFPDSSFDAAISLFGIEYGSIGKTSREMQRVLTPGARFSFLVHHSDSEILREGVERRKALQELIFGKLKTAFLTGSVAGLRQHQQRLRGQFPAEAMVDLVSDHLRRHISRMRAEREALWQKLAGDLNPEIALLMHLEQSAKSAGALGSWLVPLLSSMESLSVSVLRRGAGEPIAWDVRGVR